MIYKTIFTVTATISWLIDNKLTLKNRLIARTFLATDLIFVTTLFNDLALTLGYPPTSDFK